MNGQKENRKLISSFTNIVVDILIVYISYFLCRVIFYFFNYSTYHKIGSNLSEIFKGGLVFDTSAILYTNILFLVLAILPINVKKTNGFYAKLLKFIYVIINSISIIANLIDTKFFQFTSRRSTASIFDEFSNENNILSIFGKELINSWQLVIAAIALIFILVKFYRNPINYYRNDNIIGTIKYYSVKIIMLAIVILLCVAGMRGGIDRSTRPITLSNANQYITSPEQAPLVLNTPFSIIRTIKKKNFVDPEYFEMENLDTIYTPLHFPIVDSTNLHNKNKNVVVMIVESFSREFMGAYNKDLENGNYKGYTPFIDSLIEHSLIFEHSYTNGLKSIDGMPSVLCGIPYFVEPFFLTPAALNKLDGLAVQLSNDGYQTAFFHGAKNGSMGFEAFANATGFQQYFGRTEFDQSPDFDGENEFDGFWAIWDEPFLQFYAEEMSKMKEPFMTAVFTASSHHPFQIPQKYKDKYLEENLPIHKCIRYTDNALRRFFDNAKTKPWFNNTIFVICSDHTNMSDHDEYQTSLGKFAGPIIFYAPNDSTMVGRRKGIAQQIDIMPTILNYVAHERPYISFGIDLLRTPEKETFAVSFYNGIYQIIKDNHFIQFDGEKVIAVYALDDKLLQHNLINTVDTKETEKYLKAIIQQYMYRMIYNHLTY